METSYRTPPLMSESTGDVAIVFGRSLIWLVVEGQLAEIFVI